MTETNTNSENTNFHENSQEISTNYAEGVGKTLRDARIKQNLDLKTISQSIKISAKQVEYIETQQWDKLPEKTIILGFVRNYARLLKLDENSIIQQLSATQNLDKQVKLEIDNGVNFEATPSLKNSSYDAVSNSLTKKLTVIIAVIAFVIIAGVLLLSKFNNFSSIPGFANFPETTNTTETTADTTSVNSTSENANNANVPPAETPSNNSNEISTPENNNDNNQQSQPVNPYQ